MSRNLKRVARNFSWPLNKVWKGYLNPFHDLSSKCVPCSGKGHSPGGQFLSDSWYRHIAQGMFGAFFGDNILTTWSRERLLKAGWSSEVADNIDWARRFGFKTLTHWSDKLDQEDVNALVEADRLWDLTHTWTPKDKWKPKEPFTIPTPDEVARWEAQGMGHDSINQWVCLKARAKRYDVDPICVACKGECDIWPDAATKKKYEDWEQEQPPTGEGFQLWEDCSEGSPVSPVFNSLDELCAHAEKHCTTFGDQKTTAKEWKRMLSDGLVCHEEGNTVFM